MIPLVGNPYLPSQLNNASKTVTSIGSPQVQPSATRTRWCFFVLFHSFACNLLASFPP